MPQNAKSRHVIVVTLATKIVTASATKKKKPNNYNCLTKAKTIHSSWGGFFVGCFYGNTSQESYFFNHMNNHEKPI
jgi:hypothetical protein